MGSDEKKLISSDKVSEELSIFVSDDRLRSIEQDKSLRDYGVDSLMHFKFLLELEKKYGIAIDDDDFSFSQMGTVEGIARVLEKYVNA